MIEECRKDVNLLRIELKPRPVMCGSHGVCVDSTATTTSECKSGPSPVAGGLV